ncbi:MAG TPA: type II secretion system protein [Candidatus Paceibacterota bacterium]|nr:type II secretion system protein [Candidatus Paceibacterota bacterium]HMP19160.1 type II secretion system protein [Candidatus Paceibacterota bacterium]HMP85211.1 type II secretion system protein [Candidatus Paceibacterota bacterium]
MIKKNTQKGFTLIEMLVSVALFVIVIMVAIGSIITTIDVNRKSQSLTSVMTDLNFALESITRTIKTSESIESCVSNCEFIDQRGRKVKYLLTGSAIQQCVFESTLVCFDITSKQTEINNFNITMTPTEAGTPSNYQHPIFTINISGTAKVGPKIASDYQIQTSVSPRKLNFNNQLFD